MITMTEIAKLTGVSQATVSRVLNGNNSVNEEAKQKVLKCAKEYDYQPNIMAQSLVGNKTFLLGLLITDISNPFFGELVKSIEKAAEEKGYSLMLFDTDYDVEKEEKYYSILNRYKVDGIISVPINNKPDYVEKIKKCEVPIVSVTLDLKTVDSVYVSHYESGQKVAKHLLDVGCTSFAFVGGMRDRKEEGFVVELKSQGIDIGNHYIAIRQENKHQPQDQLAEELKIKLKAWIEKEKDTSGVGIFANNDVQALKVLEILKQLKINVPEEAAVVGFDNTYLSKITSPTLTSVAQPIDEIARLGMERIIELIHNKDEKCVRYQLDTRVIPRGSTIRMKKKVSEK